MTIGCFPVGGAAVFVGNIDDPAGVNRVIGRIEDIAGLQFVAMPMFRQLIVGWTRDDFCLQAGKGLIVYDGAEGTRCEHIYRRVLNSIGRNWCGAAKLFRFAHALFVNIADEQLCAGLVKPTVQMPSDIAQTLDCNA